MGKLRLPTATEARLIVRVLLALVVIACAWRVGFGTTPGETDVAARHSAGKPASVDGYMAYGFWFGCCFSGVAALALLMTSRWWLADGDAEGEADGDDASVTEDTGPMEAFTMPGD